MDESVAGDWPFPFLDDADPPQLSNAELQMLWDQTFAGEPFGSPHGQHNDENFQLDLEMDARFGMDPQLRGQQVPAQLQPLASYRTATDQDRARDGGATVVVQSQQPQSIEEFLGGPDAEEDSKTSQPDWVTMPHEAGQTLASETTESADNQVALHLLRVLRRSLQPSTSTARDALLAAACDKTGLTNDEIKNAEQKPLNAYLSFLVEHNILTKAEDKLVRRFRRYLKSKDDRQRYEDNGHRPPRPPKGADKPSKSTSKPYARK
eukprot:m.126188 g.126188  ORF g.126188 m.126188 type:complete len:264 (-) comp52230_c0_seq6:91-882(-)